MSKSSVARCSNIFRIGGHLKIFICVSIGGSGLSFCPFRLKKIFNNFHFHIIAKCKGNQSCINFGRILDYLGSGFQVNMNNMLCVVLYSFPTFQYIRPLLPTPVSELCVVEAQVLLTICKCMNIFFCVLHLILWQNLPRFECIGSFFLSLHLNSESILLTKLTRCVLKIGDLF